MGLPIIQLFEGVLATTSLMKFKEVCHYTYHNLYDGNSGTKKVFLHNKHKRRHGLTNLTQSCDFVIHKLFLKFHSEQGRVIGITILTE